MSRIKTDSGSHKYRHTRTARIVTGIKEGLTRNDTPVILAIGHPPVVPNIIVGGIYLQDTVAQKIKI
jgi:hypothetical protein